MSHEDELLSLRSPTLEAQRISGNMIEMYKIPHGVENVPHNAFFHLKHYAGLRGHDLSVQVERSRLNVRKKN